MALDISLTTGLVILAMWSSIWKAFALWKSARQNQWKWFVFFIFVSTVGLAEIVYLQWYQSKGKKLSHWKSWKDVKA